MLDLELQSKPWPRPWHRGWRNVFLPAFCCRFWLRVLLKPLSPVFKRIPLIHSLNWSRAPGNTRLLYSACVNSERFPVTHCPRCCCCNFLPRLCVSASTRPGQGVTVVVRYRRVGRWPHRRVAATPLSSPRCVTDAKVLTQKNGDRVELRCLKKIFKIKNWVLML